MLLIPRRSAEVRYLAYFSFEILPTNGFSGAKGHQHQRLIGRMACAGTVRAWRVGARVWVRRRDRILNAQDKDAPELMSE